MCILKRHRLGGFDLECKSDWARPSINHEGRVLVGYRALCHDRVLDATSINYDLRPQPLRQLQISKYFVGPVPMVSDVDKVGFEDVAVEVVDILSLYGPARGPREYRVHDVRFAQFSLVVQEQDGAIEVVKGLAHDVLEVGT